MKVCEKCILTDAYPGLTFDENGVCSMCTSEQVFEPFGEDQIYGYERRICQYNTMVRRGEISRDKALAMYEADRMSEKPANYQEALDLLGVNEKEMEQVMAIQPLKYEKYVSKANRWFMRLVKWIKR